MKWRLTLLSTLLSCSLISTAASAMRKDFSFSSGGVINYPAMKIQRMLFTGPEFSIQDYAKKADMYMNHFEVAWKVPLIHSQNPDVICLLYRNVRAVYQSAEEYQMFIVNEWILKDDEGVNIHSIGMRSNWIVDPGNPGYQQWVAEWMLGHLDQYGYDGVFLDNCLPSTEILWETTPEPAMNPRTGMVYSSEEFKQAMIDLVNKVKDVIGSKLVIGNGVYDGQRFFSYRNQGYVDLLLQSRIDGLESEGWIMHRDDAEWSSESRWLATINFVAWLENNFLSDGKVFTPVCQNVAPYNNQGESLPDDCTKEQYALYSFASLLLAASSNTHYINFGYYADTYVDTLLNIELGAPTNNYYMISGTHIYARDYTKIKVLVNPTNQPYQTNLNENYEFNNGTAIPSPIILDAHTGMILFRVET